MILEEGPQLFQERVAPTFRSGVGAAKVEATNSQDRGQDILGPLTQLACMNGVQAGLDGWPLKTVNCLLHLFFDVHVHCPKVQRGGQRRDCQTNTYILPDMSDSIRVYRESPKTEGDLPLRSGRETRTGPCRCMP